MTLKCSEDGRPEDLSRNHAIYICHHCGRPVCQDHGLVVSADDMAGLNTITYLTAYLDECGRNGGKPLTGKALERFLPWTASPEDLRTWAQPPPSG